MKLRRVLFPPFDRTLLKCKQMSLTPPPISLSTSDERRQWIRERFPCLADCEACGLCKIYHGRDVEDVYADYIAGTRSFEEIREEFRRL